MGDEKKKILVLVEGEKRDVGVMETLFKVYEEIDAKYEIVSYRTNIYVLYGELFSETVEPSDLDLLQVLKTREHDPDKKLLFDGKYTDILLIFDLDPQDNLFGEDKIRRMQEYFCESSDMGKLYINYPMVEAFYHMTTIPDPDYKKRTVSIDELRNKSYKSRVARESKSPDYRKFISTRQECNVVILHNINKALSLLDTSHEDTLPEKWMAIDFKNLLERQLDHLREGYIHILCTCAMYIYDYNYRLLNRD